MPETKVPYHNDDIQRRLSIYEAITRERQYQDKKWGHITFHPHSVGEWLLIIESELEEAKHAWVKSPNDAEALEELLQVITTGVACLEQHGIIERAQSTPPRIHTL